MVLKIVKYPEPVLSQPGEPVTEFDDELRKFVAERRWNATPGTFPYRRGTRTTGDWQIRQEIDATDVESANRAALAAVAGGAEGITFSGFLVEPAGELDVLLANLADEMLTRFATPGLSDFVCGFHFPPRLYFRGIGSGE